VACYHTVSTMYIRCLLWCLFLHLLGSFHEEGKKKAKEATQNTIIGQSKTSLVEHLGGGTVTYERHVIEYINELRKSLTGKSTKYLDDGCTENRFVRHFPSLFCPFPILHSRTFHDVIGDKELHSCQPCHRYFID
jgi:hypothetical protein